jgi:hypothetical protein
MIKLNSKLQFALTFAWFCRKYNIVVPNDLAQMIVYAKRSAACYARDDVKGEKKNADNLETIARLNNLEVDWPGLWPCVQIKGRPETNRTLPCDE